MKIAGNMSNKKPTAGGQKLLEAFDAIYVINLSARTDRRAQITQELARIGLSFDHPRVILWEASFFPEKGSFPLVGARGCFHSHLEILKDALQKGSNSILILEDDCDFVRGIEHKIQAALQVLSSTDWALFYGGHEKVIEPIDARPVEMIEPDRWILGAHFVGFRRNAIKDLVPYLIEGLAAQDLNPESGFKGIDGAYTHFRRDNHQFKTFLAWPKLCYQRPSRTDISPGKSFDQIDILKKLIHTLRLGKRYLMKMIR